MNSLIRLLLRYQFFLLFLVLEVFSFWLLSSHSYYQQSKFEDIGRTITGITTSRINKVTQYLKLAETNSTISQENLELKRQLAILSTKYDLLKFKLGDTLVDPLYTYKLARVVNNSVNKQYNYLTLDLGSQDGIEREMGVVSAQGIVGIVAGVSEHYCTVISLLNVDLKISAKLKRSNHFGSLYWDGKNYRDVTLSDIPQHVVVNVGDTVVTSGFSSIFPAGIDLGTIKSIESRGVNFHSITVKLFNDFKQLNTVWVVAHKHDDERDVLETDVKKR